MEPPFPGMDPYLETPGIWQDVHHRMITAICDQIQNQIVPRYVALITPYIAFESLEIAPMRMAVPDVSVYQQDALPGSPSGAVAIAPAPLTATAVMEVPTRYARVEVRTVADATLVTAIELLSPVNKRPGAEGADAYEKKRQELFRSTAHLLEIDLLRAGRRPQTVEPLPPFPYFVMLSRAEHRPQIAIWPIALQAVLPVVPVPLTAPDPDVPLDLNRVLHQVYRNARYDVQVNYRQSPPPPDLPPDDAAWLATRLRERGLR